MQTFYKLLQVKRSYLVTSKLLFRQVAYNVAANKNITFKKLK